MQKVETYIARTCDICGEPMSINLSNNRIVSYKERQFLVSVTPLPNWNGCAEDICEKCINEIRKQD